jgi:hypothetical protein
MKVTICYKHQGFLTVGMMLHYQGTPYTTCIKKQVQFNQWKTLEDSTYNTELATYNFHLLGPSRQYLPAGHCNTNADVQRYVQCVGKTKNTYVLGDHAENGNACNNVTV